MLDKWVYLIAMFVVLLGALVWSVSGLLGRKGKLIAYAVYGLVAVAALYVGARRDTYLPFLGETVLPCSTFTEHTPEHADTTASLSGLKPGAKILFWAAEPATDGLARIKTWDQAYLEFANAGVTIADGNGHATLRFRKPQPYTVPVHGQIEAHVHWRVCGDGGMLGPVQNTMIATTNE